ncbi:hypothetical protein UFOVP247_47 [uncultured Caudovirales phage]|uniref:Uncharacterized protein n=1 Tax=uncultured Caudovirales phage TaxID=2100421 RepID=A0A6J7WXS6_9CAUD|nr:hypothetical protein UFOVP247_47 [uncultured Caudovirales phage]
MTATKISGLTAATTMASGDLIPIVADPAGSPSTKKITLANFYSNVVVTATYANTVTFNANVVSTSNLTVSSLYLTYRTTPGSGSDSVPSGKIWFDQNYIYVATATNVIKRASLSTF